LQVWMLMLQFMILHFMSFRFLGSWIVDLYMWFVYSTRKSRMSEPLWDGCRQNCCWDHIVKVH
jgi:hypothetical protein